MISFCYLSVFATVLCCVTAQYDSRGGPRPGANAAQPAPNNPNDFSSQGMAPVDMDMPPAMMLPPFLQHASEAAKKEFEAIITNEKLKKSEITAKLDDWANKQSYQVKKSFDQDKKMQLDMAALMDDQRKRLVASLSKAAQEVAAKIDAVHANQDITPTQEMEQISKIVGSTSASVMNELSSIDVQLAPMGDSQAFGDPWQ